MCVVLEIAHLSAIVFRSSSISGSSSSSGSSERIWPLGLTFFTPAPHHRTFFLRGSSAGNRQCEEKASEISFCIFWSELNRIPPSLCGRQEPI